MMNVSVSHTASVAKTTKASAATPPPHVPPVPVCRRLVVCEEKQADKEIKDTRGRDATREWTHAFRTTPRALRADAFSLGELRGEEDRNAVTSMNLAQMGIDLDSSTSQPWKQRPEKLPSVTKAQAPSRSSGQAFLRLGWDVLYHNETMHPAICSIDRCITGHSAGNVILSPLTGNKPTVCGSPKA
eukprot:NODE_1818_length_749_cov_3.581429_g1414_i0.p3 GENE.NODE_1818_length_749_cov_3.581429_g1414_i0~~NODE_1818_length_749_cov_3.581429_g1414_i0.p3  ORF type:complete len:186 (-),score=35.22 NODE_1818_length_749_cov_3.581429_g1414_i0:79-636(-)